MFSIGSIITGLLLIRRNRTMMTKNPLNAVSSNSLASYSSELIRFQWHYLHGMQWPTVGLEPLAIVFSLTYALLMWSYVICVLISDPFCMRLIC
jgi:hypothetical protein